MLDQLELRKIEMNRKLFSIKKTDHFEISDVLDFLDKETLPRDIPITSNNSVFIRDLTNYLINNNLEPNINKQ